MFKKLRSIEDYIGETLQAKAPEIKRRIANNIDRRRRVSAVVAADLFDRPIAGVFKSSLANTPDQINPLEMVTGQMRTTPMGEGGITSEHKITEDAKLVDPSHLGFLDPMHTPESSRSGVTLQLALGARKSGDTAVMPLYNTKTKKIEMVPPAKAYKSKVVFPDQVKWDRGRPVALKKKIRISGDGNQVEDGSLADAQYVMPSPTQLASASSNLIPFMQNTSGNRSTMAGRHMEQALSLKHREEPLVQTVVSGDRKEPLSFNKMLGRMSSQRARGAGTVEEVTPDRITIKDEKGKTQKVGLYNYFPLNDNKSVMHSTPNVRVGDKVKSDQVLADTNFTKKGKLALGTNLETAYMPWHGLNYEDGVVVSESGAKKLTSEHMHRKGVDVSDQHIVDREHYIAHHGTSLTKDQAKKLDRKGVIRLGSPVAPGDTLIAAARKVRETDDEARLMGRMHKSLLRTTNDAAVRWESDYPGKVVQVVNRPTERGEKLEVHVRTDEPAEIGDKIAGRHGNKGILTQIVPDEQMPQRKNGKPIELIMSPASVPGRINLGQTLETAAAKIAQKTGKPYLIQNFDGTEDWNDRITKDLKKHGVEDEEEIYIPEVDKKTGKVTGSKLAGKAAVGPQYIHKFKHQAGKALLARAGGPGYAYDPDKMPKAGGPNSAQSMDALGLYAMLAHGTTSNIRSMQTYKSNADGNEDMWSALQSGDPLPPPRASFSYNRFLGYMKALGVNVNKDGNKIGLSPLTDKQTLAMSNGELKDAGRMVVAKSLEPEENGLFDKKITGGVEGTKWSHITLPERMPNPIFEAGIVGLTGIRKKDFASIMSGKAGIDAKTGKVVEGEGGLRYGKAIESLLGKVDVDKDLKTSLQAVKNPSLKGQRLDVVNRKIKFLQALKKNDLNPTDAYMVKHVPVLPPSFRPLAVLPNGDLNEDDTNGMYKALGLSVNQLAKASKLLPQSELDKRRASIYDRLQSVAGLGGYQNRKFRGILDIIRGRRIDKSGSKVGKPAEGFYQRKLVKRRQDLSARGVIVPEPDLGLDQVGIPRKAAMELYKPFVVREVRGITGLTPGMAQKEVRENTETAKRALDRVVEHRPLILKRDPVLHKYGVQAFNPVLTGGSAIKIHPLVTSGFNADFDGDKMNAYVPLTDQDVAEARKMHPSNNLFSPASGKLIYKPTKEMQLGLYMIGQKGKGTKQSYKTTAEAARAVSTGKLGMTDVATIGGQRTTVGRSMLAKELPAEMKAERQGILDGSIALDKKGQSQLLSVVGKKHKDSFDRVANKFKDIGNTYATSTAFSLSLKDLKPDKVLREKIMKGANVEADKIRALGLPQKERDKRLVTIYDRASQKIVKGIEDTHGKKGSRLWSMMQAGMKPTMETYRQIVATPGLMMNAKREVIPTPIQRSYSEGLDVADYWTSMSGARKGIIQKVQSVAGPGYVTKQVMNTVLNQVVGADDCGTKKGISLPVAEKDVLDRFLVKEVKAGKHALPAGTLITPGVRDRLHNNKVSKIVVRSPLRCEHGDGMCAKCYGLTQNGELPSRGKNVGVIAGQALGERSTQLAMRVFHSGGTSPVGEVGKQKAQLTDDFRRVQQLIGMQETIPKSAPLSTATGTVTRITKSPAGGHDVFVGDRRHYVPHDRGMPTMPGKRAALKPGAAVKRGDPLSRGPINPHELLPLTNLPTVQNYLSGQLHGIYKNQGIRRREVETVVRAVTNLGQIEDPGTHPELIRGDLVPLTSIKAESRKLKLHKPPRITPILKGVNAMPKHIRSDWMARLNREKLHGTVIDAANRGWVSNIHGTHPMPGIVHGTEFGQGKPY